MAMKKSPVQGRQKIAMKKIAKKNNLQVTFSKRRTGLFKKASELCTLCGVEVAIIVFSPAGKVFSFGHPHVESTIHRFLSTRSSSLRDHTPPAVSNTHKVLEAHRNANIHELNVQLAQLVEMLEAEKRKGEALEEMKEAGRRQWWWQAPVDELGLNELQQLRGALEELKQNVKKHVNQVLVETSTNCWPFFAADCEAKEMNIAATAAANSTSFSQMYNNFGQGLF